MAIADNALFGITSVEDLQQMEIPPEQDELILIYNEDVKDTYVLKKCTKAKGVTEEPMPKSAFCAIFQAFMKIIGYFCGMSIHAIRRYLGKKVDGEGPVLNA
jgi:hypothetical protein